MYEESGSDVDYIEDSLMGENKKNSKEDDYTNMDEEKEGKQADLLRSKITQYDHNIRRKKGENEKSSGHEGNGAVTSWKKHFHR